MTQFVIFPNDPSYKRSDRRNIFVVASETKAEAFDRVAQMTGDVEGTFHTGWNAVPLNDSPNQDMVIKSSHATPVGTRENGNIWPKLLSSGDPLAV